MKTIEQTRRELFQRWVELKAKEREVRGLDEFTSWELTIMHGAFNAALDAVVIAIPPEWPPVCEKDEGANEMRDAVLEAIESTNLGLKIR